MAHSLELLLDEASASRVRHQWSALVDAGLPSAGRHRSPTNRPHVTLVAAAHIAASADDALAPAWARLPVPMSIGAPIVFGRRDRHTLARLVIPTPELLTIHAEVFDASVPHLPGPAALAHTAPRHWTPHVTIARHLRADQLADALGAIDHRAPIDGAFTSARRWDGDAKIDHLLYPATP